MSQTKARQRGLYPEQNEPGYLHPQVSITINLDAELWGWLKGFAGYNSFFCSVEETIITALRSMAGTDYASGLSLGQLLALVSSKRGISAADAMFSPMTPEDAKAANLLLQASQLASLGVATVARFHPPKGRRRCSHGPSPPHPRRRQE